MSTPRSMRLPGTRLRAALSALLALAATGPLSAQAAPDLPTAFEAQAPLHPDDLARRLQRIRQRIDRERIDAHIPGVALGIVVADQAVLLEGFGLADIATGRAVGPDTLFAIGSTTKAFTATLCAMLVDEGKLDWDEPITKHVPEFALHPDPGPGAPWGAAPVVSVRDVLSHRTGFSRNDILWAGNSVPRELILVTAAKAEPWAPYRSAFLYNNVQVMAAGTAAARIDGQGWDAMLAQRLLEPLHMSSTNSSVAACAGDPRLALGYVRESDSQQFRQLPMRTLDAIGPAGSINSNVTDMTQWLRLLLGGGAIDGRRLVSLAALEETWSPQTAISAVDSYGLCWMLSEWQGHRLVEHGGNIDGFSAEVALLPDDGIGFVLLANVSATPLQQTSRGIVFEELVGAAAAAAAAETARAPGESRPDADAEPIAGSTADTHADPDAVHAAWHEYLGAYTCNSPSFRDEDFTVLLRGDKLSIDVPRQTVYALRAPNAQGRWVFELTDGIEIDFQRDAAGRVIALTMYQGGLALEMPKVGVEQHADEALEPLERLLGDYAGDTLRAHVMIHNQRLALDIEGQMIYELRPADEQGLRAFRALPGFSAEFEERDGVVVALLTHQPGVTVRLERRHVEGGAATPLPDLAAVNALRGASAIAANWEALGGWRLTGGVRFANAGLPGALTSSGRGQSQFHEEIDFGAFGFLRQASDGTHAWTESVFQPWRELEGRELRQALQTPPDLFGDWSERFTEIRVLRRDALDGRDAIVVALHDGDLPPVTVFVAADNGDLLRADTAELSPGGQRIPQTMLFSDWRDVGGRNGTPAVRVPFHTMTRSEDSGRVEVQYEMAETGLDFPDALFRLEPPR